MVFELVFFKEPVTCRNRCLKIEILGIDIYAYIYIEIEMNA